MNYKKQLCTFDLKRITNLSIVLFLAPLTVCALINLLGIGKPFLMTTNALWDFLIILGSYILLLPIHELIHALGAIAFGKCPIKNIKFGIIFKQGMLYCHADHIFTARAYRVMLILPVIFTGIIPLIISTFVGNFFLLILFSLLVSGGAGDLIMFMQTLKYSPDQLIADHPKAPAYYLVYPEDKLPSDFNEVTDEQETALANALKVVPYAKGEGKNNNMVKILLIMIFLGFIVGLIFVIASFMQFV